MELSQKTLEHFRNPQNVGEMKEQTYTNREIYDLEDLIYQHYRFYMNQFSRLEVQQLEAGYCVGF